MKVISFEEKKRQKEDFKRYEYIQSMCQLQRPDLFDELIAEQELTDEKIASCKDFIDSMQRRGRDPLIAFQEVCFMSEEEFYADNGVNWYITIEESLNYYATLREHDRDAYDIALQLHPFVGIF